MERKYSDATKLFDALRKKVESQSTSTPGTFGNQNLLKLKRDTSYKLRLLWLVPPDGYEREYPMLNQYVHRIWDENAIGSKNVEVYCKTSQYDEGETKAGFACPICKKMSELYKEYLDHGSASAYEIYKKFRRTLHGFVPVYVISGPQEDLHKVKILQYTKTFKDFFDENIFGITKTKKSDQDGQEQPSISENVVGIDAFTYYDPKNNEVVTKAYDLIVTVNTKKVTIDGRKLDLPDYKLAFSRKMSEIDLEGEGITVDGYLNLSQEIGFDADFFKKSTDEELIAFKNKYITNESNDEAEDDVSLNLEEDEDEVEVAQKKPSIKEVAKAKAPVKKPPVVEEEPEEESEEISNESDEVEEADEAPSKDDEDIDIDKLLEGL